jgi:hypothetical protein
MYVLVAVIVDVAVFVVVNGALVLRRGTPRLVGAPDGSPERSYVGGSLTRGSRASPPLARLEFFDWGIRLGGSVGPIRRLKPAWEARYGELRTVRFVSPGLSLDPKPVCGLP